MSRQTVLSNRRGFALEATLFVLLLLAVLCVFAVSGVTSATRTANYDYRNTRTEYAAEAASDDIMQQLGGMVDDGFISQSELDSLVRPSIPGFSIPTMTVLPNGGATQETVNDGSYAGLYALVRNYDITTRASDSSGNASQAVVTVKAAAIPIFQFGVFYEKDLEITNGQRLDMAGWVHTNGDLFTRSGGGLYLHNIVTTPNKFHFRRKDGSNPGGSDQVYIDDAGATARQVNNDTEGLPSFPAFRSWSDLRFSGRLKTNAYSVDSLRLPLPAGMPAVELIRHRNSSGTDSPEAQAAKFAWKADYYIDIDYTGLNNVCNPGVMTITRAGGRVSPDAGRMCAHLHRAAGCLVGEPRADLRRQARHRSGRVVRLDGQRPDPQVVPDVHHLPQRPDRARDHRDGSRLQRLHLQGRTRWCASRTRRPWRRRLPSAPTTASTCRAATTRSAGSHPHSWATPLPGSRPVSATRPMPIARRPMRSSAA